MATAQVSIELESPVPGTTARVEFSIQKGRRAVEWKLSLNNIAQHSEFGGDSIDKARSLIIWLEVTLDRPSAERPAEPAGFITKSDGTLNLAVRERGGVTEAGLSGAPEARALVSALRSMVDWAVVA